LFEATPNDLARNERNRSGARAGSGSLKKGAELRFTPIILITLTALSAVAIAVAPPPPRRLGSATNPVRCQIWHNLPGAQITDTVATTDLDRRPDETRSIGSLEFSPGFKDSYACVLSAELNPPVTGRYWFDIASRDSGLLFLSSDASAKDRKFVAETPAATDLHKYRMYSAETSDGVKLIAGRRYFIQAIMKSGPGPGGVSVGWTMPNGAFQGPIPTDRFSPAGDDLPPPSYIVHHFNLTLRPENAPTTQPGVHKFVRGAHIEVDGQSEDMSYLLSMPQNYDTTTDSKPMLVFLHGNNRQGYSLDALERTGPVQRIETIKALRDWMPMIVLCPQLPPDWRWDTPGAAQSVNALVEQLCQRYPRIDRRRIYITGLSMGGKGTWLTLENSPQTYAAAMPISAVDVRPDLVPQLLKNIGNLHLACGSEDGGFAAGSHRMYEALKPTLGDRVQLTVFEHEGHGVWGHYYPDKSFYEELLRFSK
jgi:hypothetical protein